ncbi:hypothetical protein [Halomonas sp. IOP_31]|uniref:hypothetical protein n=1 Tax=Halomonas sp. IOP_31 TaxID=2876584 RepID=UPI001E322C88|nr:hypothetical protein [Halomonas sp. IOP_31]MCD6006859.1 hypothetical protein [Halomonas sp. IOP_31]
MRNLIWKILARLLAWPPIAQRLIARSQRTPYFAIVKDDLVYMDRWWLFNPYNYETRQPKHHWCPISIRVHHIQQPDDDRHLHDHPWNARTIILKGYYFEETPKQFKTLVKRGAGDTARIGFGQFHRIHTVSPGGVYTLFISGKHRGAWGFLVDGAKVPWRKYLGIKEGV